MTHDFTLPADGGEAFTVDAELRAAGALLFFYRGHW